MGFDDDMDDNFYNSNSNYHEDSRNIDSLVSDFANQLTNNHVQNVELAKSLFPDLTIQDSEDGNLLHVAVRLKQKGKIVEAVKALIDAGVDVNQRAYYGYNFIQSALYEGLPEKIVVSISRYALLNGLDPNHQDSDGDTVIHSAIFSDDYKGSVNELASVFVQAGLDPTLTNIANNDFFDAMDIQNEDLGMERFTLQDKKDFASAISVEESDEVDNIIDDYLKNSDDSSEESLEDNDEEDYVIGEYMDKSAPKLVIPVDKKVEEMQVTLLTGKNVLLIGYERSGKSSILKALDHKMQTLPFFQVSYYDVISGCDSLSEIEKNMKDSFDYCMENNSVVVLEEMDKFVEFSSLTKEVLKEYLKNGLRVVGTTNYHTYEKFIQKSDLNGYFYPTRVSDYDKSELEKLMNHFCKEQKMEEAAKSSLLYYLENRKSEESIISNFGLLMDVMERANAYALNDGRDTIEKNDIQMCVADNDNFMKLKK